jgi:hypothetical protein
MVITELEMKLCDWSNLKEEQNGHTAVIIASFVVCQPVEEGDAERADTKSVEQCARDISVTRISMVHSGQHFS